MIRLASALRFSLAILVSIVATASPVVGQLPHSESSARLRHYVYQGFGFDYPADWVLEALEKSAVVYPVGKKVITEAGPFYTHGLILRPLESRSADPNRPPEVALSEVLELQTERRLSFKLEARDQIPDDMKERVACAEIRDENPPYSGWESGIECVVRFAPEKLLLVSAFAPLAEWDAYESTLGDVLLSVFKNSLVTQGPLEAETDKLDALRTPREIATRSLPSVTTITVFDKQRTPLQLGSGFFVGPDVVVTNLHVIRGGASAEVKTHLGQRLQVLGYVGVDDEDDLVLLKVDTASQPVLNVGEWSSIAVGDTVFTLGSPEGLEGTFAQGLVSAIRDLEKRKVFQITAPVSHGSSGGPVLDRSGLVVGISTATFAEGQNLNFAIPANYLQVLCKKISSPQPLQTLTSRVSSATRAKLPTDAVVGTHFAWDETLLYDVQYSFTIRNNSNEPVSHVKALVVFYDRTGKPVDTQEAFFEGVIAPKLAKRITGSSEKSVHRLAASTQVRILDFSVEP